MFDRVSANSILLSMVKFLNMRQSYQFFVSKFYPIPVEQDVASSSFFLGIAGLVLAQALQYGNGFFSFVGIFLLSLALLFLLVSLSFGKPGESVKTFFKKISFPILFLGMIWQLYQLWYSVPGLFLLPSDASTLWLFKLGVGIAGCLAALSLLPKNRISLAWQNLLVVLTLVAVWFLGVWVIKTTPQPEIDVFVFHQTSAQALLSGENPYTAKVPNIYGNLANYGVELVDEQGYLTIGNPYPPLTIYISTLGYLAAGDIRYSHLLAFLLSGALIAFLHVGREAKLAAYLFLFMPRAFFVLEQGWTEFILVFFLAAVIFCATRYPKFLPIMLGLFFASKQYLIFMLPISLLFIANKSSWRDRLNLYGWMGATMVAVTAPLAFWNLPAFLWNVGAAQWYTPFRIDALSYLALYAHVFNQAPSFLIGFLALVIALFAVWRIAPRTPSGFALSLAWCLAVFLAFNKQAFCNYYFLVIGAIFCAFASITNQNSFSQPELNLTPHNKP
jgi:hypothetical protein